MKTNDDLYWIALNRIEHVGPVSFVRLLEHFGLAEEIFKASRKDLEQIQGLQSRTVDSLVLFQDFSGAEKEAEYLAQKKIRFLKYSDSDYPECLREITGFPPVLFIHGSEKKLNNLEWLGVVGSRNVSEYGVMACRRIVRDLVRSGIGIVSGFARGIDISAHLEVLDLKGHTLGVLGCGLDYVHPSSHRRYVEALLERGALVSEFPYDMKPLPQLFPRRNRIISGLCRGTLVVEAGEKSGALITAQYALDQNRDLFAVPGSIFSYRAQGTHRLIQQGAKLVINAEDILSEWELAAPEISQPQFSDPDELSIYDFCKSQGATPDQVIEQTGIRPERVTMLLSKLELEGKIKSLPGRRYQSL